MSSAYYPKKHLRLKRLRASNNAEVDRVKWTCMESKNSLRSAELETHKKKDIDVIAGNKVKVENKKISSWNFVTFNHLEIHVHSSDPEYLNVSRNNSTEKSPSPVLRGTTMCSLSIWKKVMFAILLKKSIALNVLKFCRYICA